MERDAWKARILQKVPEELGKKLSHLFTIIESMDSALVAFSGGVDSSLLLYLAHQLLGDRMLAVIASSQLHPRKEIEEAERLAEKWGVDYRIIETKELENSLFVNNPPERCYYCKKELFGRLGALAKQQGYRWVLDGSNYEDLVDYRPGMKAGREMKVRSPLQEAGLDKEDIREISRCLSLPTANKPSQACLASRIPYGTVLEEEKLRQVEEGEEYLWSLGLSPLRLRLHGELARIEINEDCWPLLREKKSEILHKLRGLGFIYVTLDLQGFRSGSMNEALQEFPE